MRLVPKTAATKRCKGDRAASLAARVHCSVAGTAKGRMCKRRALRMALSLLRVVCKDGKSEAGNGQVASLNFGLAPAVPASALSVSKVCVMLRRPRYRCTALAAVELQRAQRTQAWLPLVLARSESWWS